MLLTYPTYSTGWRIAQLEGVEEGISRKARMKLAAPGAPAALQLSRQEAVRCQLAVRGSDQGNCGGNRRPS